MQTQIPNGWPGVLPTHGPAAPGRAARGPVARIGPPGQRRRRPPPGSPPSSLFTAAGTALLPPTTVGDSSVNPPVLYWARPAADSVYFTNAIAAGVGLPMTVMSITCGEPLFVALAPLLVIVTVALAYCAASAALARLMASGSLMYGRCSSIAWVMNALEASSWPDCSVESSEDSA